MTLSERPHSYRVRAQFGRQPPAIPAIVVEDAAKALGLPAISDDSGLVVEALNGAPGVKSARYAGEKATDKQNIDKSDNRII